LSLCCFVQSEMYWRLLERPDSLVAVGSGVKRPDCLAAVGSGVKRPDCLVAVGSGVKRPAGKSESAADAA
jgi:hypothetical protein